MSTHLGNWIIVTHFVIKLVYIKQLKEYFLSLVKLTIFNTDVPLLSIPTFTHNYFPPYTTVLDLVTKQPVYKDDSKGHDPTSFNFQHARNPKHLLFLSFLSHHFSSTTKSGRNTMTTERY